MASLSELGSNPKSFVFGPQAISFDVDAFHKLRLQLQETPRSQWALNTAADLPSEWGTISENIKKLQDFDGKSLLERLNEWLVGAPIPEGSFPLPNTLLSPLVVIAQLIQYCAFLEAALPELRDTDELPATTKASTETLGLCTGTLSAFVVACSSSLADIGRYGAVAVRLAMLAGALVDAEEAARDVDDKSMSFSASWSAEESGISDVLGKFPEVNTSP